MLPPFIEYQELHSLSMLHFFYPGQLPRSLLEDVNIFSLQGGGGEISVSLATDLQLMNLLYCPIYTENSSCFFYSFGDCCVTKSLLIKRDNYFSKL